MGRHMDTPRRGTPHHHTLHTQPHHPQIDSTSGPVYSGVLRFDLQRARLSTGALLWEEVPQRPLWQTKDTLTFNARYDKVHKVH